MASLTLIQCLDDLQECVKERSHLILSVQFQNTSIMQKLIILGGKVAGFKYYKPLTVKSQILYILKPIHITTNKKLTVYIIYGIIMVFGIF